MRRVREGKWPHLTLTLAVLCGELRSDPAVLSAHTSRHDSPFPVSLCHSYASTHGDKGLVIVMWGGSVHPKGPEWVLKGRSKVASVPLDYI